MVRRRRNSPLTIALSVEDISAQRRGDRAAAEHSNAEIVGLHWPLASPEGLYVTHQKAIYERTKLFQESHTYGDLCGHDDYRLPMQRNVQEGWIEPSAGAACDVLRPA